VVEGPPTRNCGLASPAGGQSWASRSAAGWPESARRGALGRLRAERPLRRRAHRNRRLLRGAVRQRDRGEVVHRL